MAGFFGQLGGLGGTLKNIGKEVGDIYNDVSGKKKEETFGDMLKSGGGVSGIFSSAKKGGIGGVLQNDGVKKMLGKYGPSVNIAGFKFDLSHLGALGSLGNFKSLSSLLPTRTYKKGFIPKINRSENDYRPMTIRDTGEGQAQTCNYVPNSIPSQPDGLWQTFEDIKATCIRNGTLWEDPDFKCEDKSLFYHKPPSAWPNIQWKRPSEICSNPQMFVDGANRMDINQGILGDCWLLAAVASLSTREDLLHRVVPQDQSFDEGYAGIFKFLFWQYGRWVEVYVDDRLPTQNNKLIYMHSTTRNEFWSALLEKAYAKLTGSYEALSGGLTSEALTDFTGGFVERYELGRKAPQDLFAMMLKAHKKSGLMGCSIDAPEGQMEAHLDNGLIIGHAYSITDVRYIQVQTSSASGKIPMVRVRNPWGDSHEWEGAWSDDSREWNSVSDSEKQEMGLVYNNDGEFWMSYKDFVSNFERLEICYLGPDAFTEEERMHKIAWEGQLFEGGWRSRVNAGGCRNYPGTFWTNPQYHVTIIDPDEDDDDGNGTMLIALMQKERRKLMAEGKDNLTIGYAVYQAPDTSTPLDQRYFRTRQASAKSTAFINMREVSDHHKLAPGHYVVVPSTFEPGEEAEFVLRIYSETKRNTGKELDDVTGISDVQPEEVLGGPTEEEQQTLDEGQRAFVNLVGQNGEIDAFQLQDILNEIFAQHFQFDGFTTDVTRSMVSMRDPQITGKLNYSKFNQLWTDLTMCKKAFKEMDTDQSGTFSSYELRSALSMLGFHVSNATFNGIVMRYSDNEGFIRFHDFVACYVRMKTLFETFRAKDQAGYGKARFALDEFAASAL